MNTPSGFVQGFEPRNQELIRNFDMQNTLEYSRFSPRWRDRVKSFLRRNRRLLVGCAVVSVLYVGCYISMSVFGRFEPAVIGTNGVKWYGWAPAGFVHKYRWNKALLILFWPLHRLDERFWHHDLSKYPRNIPSDIEDVYRAWK